MKKFLIIIFLGLMFACTASPEGQNQADCDDGKDNDYDGRYDCDDDGCFASTTCANLSRLANEQKQVAEEAKKPKDIKPKVDKKPELGPTFKVDNLLVQTASNANNINWANADYYCKNLNLINISNWRLPSQEEAVKIVESGQLSREDSYVMWTSTKKNKKEAVIVGMSGPVNFLGLYNKGDCRARCVSDN